MRHIDGQTAMINAYMLESRNRDEQIKSFRQKKQKEKDAIHQCKYLITFREPRDSYFELNIIRAHGQACRQTLSESLFLCKRDAGKPT